MAKIYNMNGYKLHVLSKKGYREYRMHLQFRRHVKKEEITIRNLLFGYLSYTNSKYKTPLSMRIENKELYGPNYDFDISISGKTILSELFIKALNENLTEKGMLNRTIDYFIGMIMEPNFKDNRCDEKLLNDLKEKLKFRKLHDLDNKNIYVSKRLLENVDEDYIGLDDEGYLEDIDKITPEDIYNYYQQVINEDQIDLIVVGDFDPIDIKNIFSERLKLGNKINKYNENIYLMKSIKEKEKVVIEEDKELKQSILTMLYKINYDEKDIVTSLIFKLILGSDSTSSKLGIELREKRSLCYYVRVSLSRFESYFCITSGINANNFDEVHNIIINTVNDIKNGNITEEELNKAKAILLDGHKKLENTITSVLSKYISMHFNKIPPVTKTNKMIKQLTKEDVIEYAKKISVDTTFFLKGAANEEN